MQVRKSAQTVADHLFAAEIALDEAIRATAALAGAIPAARLEAKVSAVIGQDAFAGASRTMVALTEARAEMLRTHDALDEMKNRVGLRHVMLGEDKDPPVIGSLTVVAERQRA